jgi:molecular chaperone DnaK
MDERPWIPSLIYLKGGENPLFGDDAEQMLQSDPGGVLVGFKRRLKETRIRLNGVSEEPRSLLAKWFAFLRKRAAAEIREFQGSPPTEVVLTVPAMCLPRERDVYTQAASEAGFAGVTLVEEPTAAARFWLSMGHSDERAVIVLDCGGGTVDWALVHQRDGMCEHDEDVPPGGDPYLGGEDVNEEIVALIERSLPDGVPESDLPRLGDMARRAKEHYCRTGKDIRYIWADRLWRFRRRISGTPWMRNWWIGWWTGFRPLPVRRDPGWKENHLRCCSSGEAVAYRHYRSD